MYCLHFSISKRSYILRFTLGGLRNALGDAISALASCIAQGCPYAVGGKSRGGLSNASIRLRHTSTRQSKCSSWTAKAYAKDTKKIVNADVVSIFPDIWVLEQRAHQGSRLGDGCHHRIIAAGTAGVCFWGISNLLLHALVLVVDLLPSGFGDVDVVGGSISPRKTRTPREMDPLTYCV